ncbi:MAG: DUF4290 domain-containing protein [Cytophagaceae bacterium]|nr:DUF4290 domain-containing protein [Cytophagaceae bacterium]MDW8456937.1 DUF4290 domain-containing protein [Cytophagaceae bacterium]
MHTLQAHYNTQQPEILLREYGRIIQNLVEYILTVEDREKRSELARSCIQLMRIINPQMKDTVEHNTKLWDQLYIMSNFKLDVDTPYPMPDKAAIGKKPNRLEYPMNNLRYRHYGRIVELLIEKATKIEDEQEKEAIVVHMGKLMKRLYCSWNKENVEDEVILEQIKHLSRNKLTMDIAKIKEHSLFDTTVKVKPQGGGGDDEKDKNKNKNQHNNGKRKNRNKKNKRK